MPCSSVKLCIKELLTQAYTRKPCVYTEKPMCTQDNFNQSKEIWRCCVDTEKVSAYSRELVCGHIVSLVKFISCTHKFLFVDTGSSCVSFV